MADCYYHGYSGSPGPCPDCAREDAEGRERGTVPGSFTGDVWEAANRNSLGPELAAKLEKEKGKKKDPE